MEQERVIALGFFDGVHMGHGQLLSHCRQEADRLGCKAAAVTFDRHPNTMVFGEKVPLLSTPRDREFLMRHLYGIEEVLTLEFNEELREMPWMDFLTEILIGRFHAKGLICGHDFRFGARGEGDGFKLQAAAARLGLSCAVVPEYQIEGATVSSTLIRHLLSDGELDRARDFLGHPPVISGTVVEGNHIGRTIGIPTANLIPDPELLLPPKGVYGGRVRTPDGVYEAVTNIGTRPTVDGQRLTVEPWLLDFDGDLYGKEISVELWTYLRPERKFPDLSALREEIRKNAVETRVFFSDRSRT